MIQQSLPFLCQFWEYVLGRVCETCEYELAVWRGIMIPVPREVIRLIVHTQNNGSNFPQFLISDPWNNGQFG